jgi:hypothetical protein
VQGIVPLLLARSAAGSWGGVNGLGQEFTSRGGREGLQGCRTSGMDGMFSCSCRSSGMRADASGGLTGSSEGGLGRGSGSRFDEVLLALPRS